MMEPQRRFYDSSPVPNEDRSRGRRIALNTPSIAVVFDLVEPVRAVWDDGRFGGKAEIKGLKQAPKIGGAQRKTRSGLNAGGAALAKEIRAATNRRTLDFLDFGSCRNSILGPLAGVPNIDNGRHRQSK
jgi:hypothetical protein